MTIVPAPYLVIEDFLDEDDHERLLETVIASAQFTPAMVTAPGATVGDADPNQRRSAVATVESQVFELFEDKLTALLPHVRRELGINRFTTGVIERQITAHTDGDFFQAHTDIGDVTSEASARRVSYVFYFNESPRRFEGGELVLFDQLIGDDGSVGVAETFQLIEPLDNTIVFFPSHVMHEVRPVRSVGDAGAAGATRYSVNGWFRDADHVRAEPRLDPATRAALAHRYLPGFTETGFTKMSTPPAVHRAIRSVYESRIETHHRETLVDEYHLPTGRPDFVDIDDVKHQFQFALQAIHEEWSGVELEPTAAYGLRVYRAGQTLIPHTDRIETHVVSSIVHIAHETNEPWPLTIVDLAGCEHEIVLEEGEMLLYESAKCPHGRPEPLDGDAYCSLFLHYRPIDWDVTTWSLVERAQRDEATDLLPPALWPVHLRPAAPELPGS